MTLEEAKEKDEPDATISRLDETDSDRRDY
jgi:hypothetical protein